ncbi:hypothetical protein C8Q79DRAFT_923823 [Trametes meyenii]|nr:hypothetical protein C8Q79DRAFT_923823 [Trametes meyenii]
MTTIDAGWDKPTGWPVTNLSMRAHRILTGCRSWTAMGMSMRIHVDIDEIPKYVISLEGLKYEEYNPLNENKIRDVVVKQARTATRELMIELGLGDREADRKADEALEGIKVVLCDFGLKPGQKRSKVIANVFCSPPPTTNPKLWIEWRDELARLSYPTETNDVAHERQAKRCEGCHDIGHPSHKCPFTTDGRWKGEKYYEMKPKNPQPAARWAAPPQYLGRNADLGTGLWAPANGARRMAHEIGPANALGLHNNPLQRNPLTRADTANQAPDRYNWQQLSNENHSATPWNMHGNPPMRGPGAPASRGAMQVPVNSGQGGRQPRTELGQWMTYESIQENAHGDTQNTQVYPPPIAARGTHQSWRAGGRGGRGTGARRGRGTSQVQGGGGWGMA